MSTPPTPFADRQSLEAELKALEKDLGDIQQLKALHAASHLSAISADGKFRVHNSLRSVIIESLANRKLMAFNGCSLRSNGTMYNFATSINLGVQSCAAFETLRKVSERSFCNIIRQKWSVIPFLVPAAKNYSLCFARRSFENFCC